ncbi:MAG: AAA family ATPase [Phycisphaerales bacterium]|nr:AAA family ATPase [Phycisphaerales bacterium]
MPKPIINYLQFRQPTADQTNVLNALETFVNKNCTDDFFILKGAAGTGKTSLVTALVGYLNDAKQMYRICAPTGRAARIINKKTDTISSTIHALIYKPIESEVDEYDPVTRTKKKVKKIVFSLRKLIEESIVIVDEASMIGQESEKDTNSLFVVERGLIHDIVKSIKGGNVNSKIIFIGDDYQLPPVGERISPALDQDFLTRTFNLSGKTYELKEIKRQEDGSTIITNATAIKERIDSNQPSAVTNDLLIDAPKIRGGIYNAVKEYVRDYKKNEGSADATIALAVSNKANDFFNKLVRDEIYGQAKQLLEAGDLLMVLKNWKRGNALLYNGDHVKVLSVELDKIETVADLNFVPIKIKRLLGDQIEIDDYALLESIINPGGEIPLELERKLHQVRKIKNKVYDTTAAPENDRYVGALRMCYGHSITAHKAQGGEWKKVFINSLGVGNPQRGVSGLKWQYTAITRAQETVKTFGKDF